jgi:hypothetical protein
MSIRTFTDESGGAWTASVAERDNLDYKGRFEFVLQAQDEEAGPLPLSDIRWNSLETAERTLKTMSEVELRRKLRSALGRAATL